MASQNDQLRRDVNLDLPSESRTAKDRIATAKGGRSGASKVGQPRAKPQALTDRARSSLSPYSCRGSYPNSDLMRMDGDSSQSGHQKSLGGSEKRTGHYPSDRGPPLPDELISRRSLASIPRSLHWWRSAPCSPRANGQTRLCPSRQLSALTAEFGGGSKPYQSAS
jgi:hypothetical protein